MSSTAPRRRASKRNDERPVRRVLAPVAEPAAVRAPGERPWRLGVAIVLALGTLLSAALAAATYHVAAQRTQRGFADEARTTVTALGAEFARDDDYVATERTLFATFPHLTNTTFAAWSRDLAVTSRFPGALGFGLIARVRADRLAAFARTLAADPLLGFSVPRHGLQPYPSGARAAYCLMRLAFSSRRIAAEAVATYDYCARLPGVSFASALARAEATGATVVVPPVASYPGLFSIVAPVYRAGPSPADAAARRRALIGWAIGDFSAPAMLHGALAGLHGYGATLRTTGAAPATIASIGPAHGAYRTTRPLGPDAAFAATVTRTAGDSALDSALLVGLLALGVTALLVCVFWLLARSRARALDLVEERTGELRYQALHDALTGLPNRALIIERAEELLERARTEPLTVGILFIDLDNFKDINDSFGHQRGDELLCAVAGRLSAVARANDSVGRLGGDEFVILVAGAVDGAGPSLLAERVLEALAAPFLLEGTGGLPLALRASIGVAAGLRASADELLRDADVALYQAKQSGRGRFVLFHPEMQLAVQDRLALELDLRQGLEHDELFVEYQPTFDLRSLQMNGVEALVRWRSATRGIVGPDQFIPVAEDSGLILPIGRFVLRTACVVAARWARRGHRVPLSVNVSGRQLDADDLVPAVADALRESGLDPALLTLELTESVLMRDTAATVERLRALKALGVRIVIDDFGTGYSSLAYVRQFPVDGLKIDRCFVSAVARSPEARALVRMLVQLGKTLGIETVAEGIEDEAQLSELRREQCDHGQGFYYARPLPVAALEAFLDEAAPSLPSA